MSYIKAEEILPQELIEMIQQYVDGRNIYIPCKEKQSWGAGTDTKRFLRERNQSIWEDHRAGMSVSELATSYCLAEKSIQRILRDARIAAMECLEQIG